MKISGMNGASPQAGQMGGSQLSDSISKNLQKQIANKQKQLQELSSNGELSLEEKRKKRQEIMQEINDLNNQLRQHQIELRREAANAQKTKEKDSSMEELTGKNKKENAQNKGTGFSNSSMKAMISADSSLKQAQVQGSVATAMENRAGVLRAEIKQDSGRTDVEAKKEELAEVEQKENHATASQMNTLDKANKEIKKSQETEEIIEQKENKQETKLEKQEKMNEEQKESAENPDSKQKKYPSIDVYL